MDHLDWVHEHWGTAGHLRPRGHRPPGVPDRPVQPAVLLLHAGGGSGLAAERRGAHRRRGGPADHHRRRAAGRPTRSGSPAASRCCAGACADIVRRTAALRPRPETSITTNALGLTRTAAALAAAGLDRVNVSLDTVRRDDFHDDHPARPAPRRGRRARGRVGRRPGSGQGQRRAAAGGQRRPGPRAAALVPRAWLRAALHRADAARRPAPLEPRRTWSPRRRSSPRSRRSSTWSPPRSRGAVRRPSCSPSTVARQTVGVIASVTRPVLRRLRPGPAHRRRAGPQLPVRPRGERPAGRAARRCRRRGARRALARRDAGQAARATASTTSRSCSRPDRCRPSAADGPHARSPDPLGATDPDACPPSPAVRPGRMIRMRLFAAVVPPREVLEEIVARRRVGSAAPCRSRCPVEAVAASAPGSRRTPRRPSRSPAPDHSDELDAPSSSRCTSPITSFGNVTHSDGVRLAAALREEASRLGPAGTAVRGQCRAGVQAATSRCGPPSTATSTRCCHRPGRARRS